MHFNFSSFLPNGAGSKVIILFNSIAWDFLTVYTNDGLNLNCGYSTIIEICNYLREKNIDTFELGELNQRDFPGVYQFKIGFVKDPKYINYLIDKQIKPGSIVILHMPEKGFREHNLKTLDILLSNLNNKNIIVQLITKTIPNNMFIENKIPI